MLHAHDKDADVSFPNVIGVPYIDLRTDCVMCLDPGSKGSHQPVHRRF